MDFQVVVLAGGTSKKLVPLVSKEVPKALLPVANRPVISYVLELLEQSNLKDLIVVVEGEESAFRVGGWISAAFVDRLHIEKIGLLQLMGQRGLCVVLTSCYGVNRTLEQMHRILRVVIYTLIWNQKELAGINAMLINLGCLVVQVATVPEDVGTAGALRAIAPHLTASDILVVSGDLVCDVPPGAVAAVHRRHDAVVTAMLCSAPVSGPSESGSSGGKDKVKKPSRCDVLGLDPTKQFLLHVAAGTEVEKDVRIQKSILRAVGQMEIRADLMDAHLYAFKSAVLLEVLDQKENFQSLKQDVLPYLVRTQLRSEVLANTSLQAEEKGNEKVSSQSNRVILSQLLANASTPSFHELYAMGPDGSACVRKRTHKCCVYIASKNKYCARLNSIQAFSDINRDVVGEANHLSGYSFSAQNNIIHPSAELGSKTTVGPHCMLGEGSQMGDKCSVKRSVVGRHCRIGSNVKIVNAVVMNHVTIGDGCSIQGSVICSNVQLQERVVLKDCQVGAGYVVTAGSEQKGESLAKREKSPSI